jgi:hypothetical protein
MLDASELQMRRARLAQRREERQAEARSAVGGWNTPYIELLALVVIAFMALGAGYAVPWLLLGSDEGKALRAYEPAITIGCGALGWIAAAVTTGLPAWRVEKRRRWRRVFAALEQDLGGRRARSVADTAGWFDSYWAGPFAFEMGVGGYGGVIDAVVDGFPALLLIDPAKWNDERDPKTCLLVAAVFPRLAPRPAPGRFVTGSSSRDSCCRRTAARLPRRCCRFKPMSWSTATPSAGSTSAASHWRFGRRLHTEPEQIAQARARCLLRWGSKTRLAS